MRIVIILMVSLLIISCTKDKDYYYGLDKVHDIQIKQNSEDEYSDSFSDSIKIGYSFDVYYRIEDYDNFENNDKVVEFIFEDSTFNYERSEDNTTFYPLVEGNHIITVRAIDLFKKYDDAIINLYAFKNLTPVSRFTIERLNPSLLTINIDASGSYDRDSEFGGYVVKYNYVIGSFDIETHLTNLTYEFLTPGTYNIKVRAMDNDGEWGSFTEEQYLLSK